MSKFDKIRAEIQSIQAKHRDRPEMMRGMRVPYYRRGEMSIPAFKKPKEGSVEVEGRELSLKLMGKAASLPIDFFFYDLEDASPDNPDYKVFARQFVVEALTSNDYGKRVVAFRPNNIRTAYFEHDLVEVVSQAGHKLNAMVIPKTEYADEVQDIVRIVKQVQKLAGHDNEIVLECLIESPRGFLEAEKIAAIDGVAALIFGAWDFARTIGGKVEPDSWVHDQQVARQMLPIIAAAYGKDAVDAVTGTLPIRPRKPEQVSAEDYKAALLKTPDDLDPNIYGADFLSALRKRERALDLAQRDASNARNCGYAAKWILHPDQIDSIQGAWTPSRDEALKALQLAAD
ncbi:MAG: hypothetical protein KC561_15555, partial [Myxococcales bacterium]|nr:hypothetical protein [Myxococcales bacterium]